MLTKRFINFIKFITAMAEEQSKELAHDLRQTYVEIMSEHLKDMAEARKSDNNYIWFKSLEDIHTIMKHKFKKKTDHEEYLKLKKKVVECANLNKNEWLGKGSNITKKNEIETLLRELEQFLWLKMDESKMFGSKMEDDGL